MKSNISSFTTFLAAVVSCVTVSRPIIAQEQNVDATVLSRSYQRDIQPLLRQFCYECHSGERIEAEVDLATLEAIDQSSHQTRVWQQVREMLTSAQMPPNDASQPDDGQQERLRNWVHQWLRHIAQKHAGDPGPVTLRRLTNAEYNYTLRDLTRIESLDPTNEFPVDGAAGEGFTNVGSAQGISPSLVTKYLEAGKQVARHAVLHPDGIRFSRFTSRRDHTDELLSRIQEFYRRFTKDGGGTQINLDGKAINTNQGGLLPIGQYLTATIEQRDALTRGNKTVEEVARNYSLSSLYLTKLWQLLADQERDAGLWLSDLRSRWHRSKTSDVDSIVGQITDVQRLLWKFNLVGQIGRKGGPSSWLEAVTPINASHELRHRLPETPSGDVSFYLVAHDLGDGNEHDLVVWQRPRIEFPDSSHPPVLLRDVRGLSSQIDDFIAEEAARTKQYLDAIIELQSSTETSEAIAKSRNLNPSLLQSWAAYLGLGQPVAIIGHLTRPQSRVHGYEAINGWTGSGATPSLLTNRSTDPVSFLTLTVPARGVTVHPTPESDSIVSWQSPIDGRVKIRGLVADADDKCGNGFAWRLELRDSAGKTQLLDGKVENGETHSFSLQDDYEIRKHDVVSLVIMARDKNHVCDTTHIDLTISEHGGKDREWNLSADVVDHILAGNPAADSYGNRQTWHFVTSSAAPQDPSKISAESAPGRWRRAVLNNQPVSQTSQLGAAVQRLMTESDGESLSDADRELRARLLDWKGPLRWLRCVDATSPGDADSAYGIDVKMFGTAPNELAVDSKDLCFQAPRVVEVRLPAKLAAGGEFVSIGKLHSATATGGSVQFQILSDRPQQLRLAAAPLVIGDDDKTRQRVEQAMKEFREHFPAALCYARIVPVDEVVTLNLYYRDDKHLKRLMLDSKQTRELDRLWDQLYFVGREPLELEVAFEQIKEFATQDRPDLVIAFAPMEKPVRDRAEAFKKRLLQTEPTHVNAVIELANHAWRRPLTDREQQDLRQLYADLRSSDLSHEESIRLLLARVFTAPAFLYKLERQPTSERAEYVSDLELATRLSYFLWSSLPDRRLRESADAGRLRGQQNQIQLLAETERMLKDPRMRRLAIHFACQWLHVRDFNQNNDKNESLYPEFATLRHLMYEETVRFFENMIRVDGSILDMINADHTFLNEALAKHYGIDGIQGSHWRQVNQIRASGRGGVLSMATVLASQSGASRTSPILRGNWIYETLLGERLPRPPANVPDLPDTVPSGLTARELIERHSSQAECAKCHRRIDPYGFALEQFDAIGRHRPMAVDTKTKLMDGTEIDGIDGLRQHLATTRRDDFVHQFCRKLLGYALGREVMLSDEPLLDEMHLQLEASDFRFSTAVKVIVRSRQFGQIRGSTYDRQRSDEPGSS